MSIANRNVYLATAEQSQAAGFGGRSGTVDGLTIQDFADIFGDPHETDIDGKVRAAWYFTTPRGQVSVHDYWWNQKDELSIGLRNGDKDNPRGDDRATLWLGRYLRERGIKAYRGARR